MHTRTSLGGVLVAAAFAVSSGAALADETDETADQVNKAVAVEGMSPVVANPEVSIPSTGSGLVTLGEGTAVGEVTVDLAPVAVELPAGGAADQAGGTTVFDAAGQGAEIAVQPTADGVRALVAIDRPEAPERYPFALRGDVVGLEHHSDGGVGAYDAAGQLVARIAPAWARDADDRAVPTFYEIEGTTLVQVVEHRGVGWTYGITADPTIEWRWHWPHKARVWFSRRETRKIHRNLYGPASAAAAGATACGYIPVLYVKLACQATVLSQIADFTGNVSQAQNRGKCLTVDVRWFPNPWLNWQDRGGGRCR